MSKHTLGPWILKIHPQHSNYSKATYWLYSLGENYIAHWSDDVVPGEANARIMAAAPEMFEALIELSQRPSDYFHADDWNLIANALARAKGEK